MALLSFVCGLNALLFLYLAIHCFKKRDCKNGCVRHIFLIIAVISLFIGLGEVVFEFNIMAMNSAIPVPALALVDERKLLFYKLVLTIGGVILFWFLTRFKFKSNKS